MRCARYGPAPIRGRDSRKDVLQIFASHESKTELKVGEAEAESVGNLVQLVGVRVVVFPNAAIVGAAGDAQRSMDLLGSQLTIQQIVEQRPQLPPVFICAGHPSRVAQY
jgi:hypothetical protein